jgi:hypothetical protein
MGTPVLDVVQIPSQVLDNNANSYVSLDDATTYMDERLGSDMWYQFDATDQTKALITAFRHLERISMWKGAPSLPLQRNRWPRVGVRRQNGWAINGVMDYLPFEIPVEVIRAQCEEALAILEINNDPAWGKRRIQRRQGVRGKTMGGSTTFAESWTDQLPRYVQGNLWSEEAYGLIRPFLMIGGTIRGDRDPFRGPDDDILLGVKL